MAIVKVNTALFEWACEFLVPLCSLPEGVIGVLLPLKIIGKEASSPKPIQANHLSVFNHTTVSLRVITARTGGK